MSTSLMTFDFEPFVTKMLPELDNTDTESLINPFGAFRGDPKHRTVVCRHWLLGLCQNGPTCGYLHRLDRSKMPTCKHGKLCKIKNCHLKHIDDQEVSECIFFKQGFCYNGPNCVRRHIKRLPDEVPREAAFDQGISSASGGAGGSSGAGGTGTAGGGMNSSGVNTGAFAMNKKKKGGASDNYKVSLCNHWLLNGTCHFGEECHFAHGEDEIQEGGHQTELLNDIDIFDPVRFKMDAELILPFPLTTRISYFLFQAPDLRSLLISKRRGVWSVPIRLAAEINAALRAYDQVVAYMCVRSLKGIYSVVKIAGQVPAVMPHMQHNAQMTPEFPVQLLRMIRISMRTVAQLKIGNSGMFVGRTLTDSKFESKVGSEIMYIAYRKPQWDWSVEGQYNLAEQYLINQRAQTGEIMQNLPPDMLFGSDWIDIQMNGGIDPRAKYLSTSSSSSSTSMMNNNNNNYISTSAQQANTTSTNNNALITAALNTLYPHDYPAFIVMGTGPVAAEMMDRHVFGLPIHLKDLTISPGTALFLLDPPAQLLLGVFQATTPVTENIETHAFMDWSNPMTHMMMMASGGGNGGSNNVNLKSMLPIQIRFSVLVETHPIHIMDPELQAIFREVGGLPMGGQIPLKETKVLIQLFAMRAGLLNTSTMNSISSGGEENNNNAMFGQQQQMMMMMNGNKRSAATAASIYGVGGTSAAGAADGSGGSVGTYKPPFKNVSVVVININASAYELKRRLLGTNGSIVVQIATEVAGSPRGVKIRIRGIGSGFFESHQLELQEPLHFNISAETEEMLIQATEKVKNLVAKVKLELESGMA